MSDLISRQDAIDALAEQMPTPLTPDGSHPADEMIFMTQEIYADCIETIEILASAQPEIIRCKDCKWYGRADKRRFYRGMDCLQKRIDTIIPDKDFCSRAERRTDETD